MLVVAAVVLGLVAVPGWPGAATPPGARDVIVQLFEWNWRSVAAECRDHLGPAGYGAVQVSPPQEHVVLAGRPWWQDYQPVSYTLTTRRGDRAGFAAMVSACHAAGVKVYADAVINHMAGAMANASMLAWTYGTPTVMSSYEYSSNDEGPPSTADGTTSDSTCFTNRWRCEHRWRVISNMVAFHNVARGTDVRSWWDNGNDLIAFGRGAAGYLVINDEPSAATGRYWQTSLPAGRYCDVFHGELVNGACSGPSYVVDSSGWFRADVAAHDGLALHIGARST